MPWVAMSLASHGFYVERPPSWPSATLAVEGDQSVEVDIAVSAGLLDP